MHWCFLGPAEWDRLYPFCDSALHPVQSPINVDQANAEVDDGLQPLSSTYDSLGTSVAVVRNTGRTLQVLLNSTRMTLSGKAGNSPSARAVLSQASMLTALQCLPI